MAGIYFDSGNLDENPPPAYVVWVDVMGTQARMSRSVKQTANFIFKLHVGALNARTAVGDGLRIYPVMDGFYASSFSQRKMLDFLRHLFRSLADEFNSTDQQIYRFLTRGCLAFGPIIHGRDIQDDASWELAKDPNYRNSILLGMPMVQAHSGEVHAPPFGIYVHESARSSAPVKESAIHELWWRWAPVKDQTWVALKENLRIHFEWCEARCLPLDYKLDRIKAHAEMAQQYFGFLMSDDE